MTLMLTLYFEWPLPWVRRLSLCDTSLIADKKTVSCLSIVCILSRHSYAPGEQAIVFIDSFCSELFAIIGF